jgi:hypothetical protein
MDIERARALTVEDFHRRAAALRPREADADREVIAAVPLGNAADVDVAVGG